MQAPLTNLIDICGLNSLTSTKFKEQTLKLFKVLWVVFVCLFPSTSFATIDEDEIESDEIEFNIQPRLRELKGVRENKGIVFRKNKDSISLRKNLLRSHFQLSLLKSASQCSASFEAEFRKISGRDEKYKGYLLENFTGVRFQSLLDSKDSFQAVLSLAEEGCALAFNELHNLFNNFQFSQSQIELLEEVALSSPNMDSNILIPSGIQLARTILINVKLETEDVRQVLTLTRKFPQLISSLEDFCSTEVFEACEVLRLNNEVNQYIEAISSGELSRETLEMTYSLDLSLQLALNELNQTDEFAGSEMLKFHRRVGSWRNTLAIQDDIFDVPRNLSIFDENMNSGPNVLKILNILLFDQNPLVAHRADELLVRYNTTLTVEANLANTEISFDSFQELARDDVLAVPALMNLTWKQEGELQLSSDPKQIDHAQKYIEIETRLGAEQNEYVLERWNRRRVMQDHMQKQEASAYQ